MIYLYSLPSMVFNSPNINVPLIKGYLSLSNIQTKQIDLSLDFLNDCITTTFFKSHFKKKYNLLTKKDKKIIDNINVYIEQMRMSKINSNKIILANEKVNRYLTLLSNNYSFEWKRRDLYFNVKIESIDDLIKFSLDKSNTIFDSVLHINNKTTDNDIFYLSVQYPYQLPYAIRFCNIIKSKNDKVKIIFGGDYITHIIKNSKELMEKCQTIDSICFFGNHEVLLNVLKYYNGETDDSNIPNTYIRNREKIIYNTITKNEKMVIDKYIPCFEDLKLNDYLSNLKMIPLTLNHGCYHSKCNFCSRYYYYNGYCRYNIDKIFNYIRETSINEKIEAIYFVDECVPPDVLISLAKYLIKNNINICWMVETRIDKKYSDKKIAELLYKSGCREISFGVESYNQKILNHMNKNINLKTMRKVLKNFYQSGVIVSATFMIGYPTESIFNIYRTLYFIKHFKYIDTFGLGVFNYMRNSILVNNCEIDEKNDLNLIYRTNDDITEDFMKIIHKFNLEKKIYKFSTLRKKILYRTEYMYLDRKIFSLNYNGGK